MNESRSPKAAVLVSVVFLAAVLGFANLRLVTGKDLPRWDAFTYYCPAQILVADHARSGELVRWNPWASAGSPDGTDPQFGAFSPVNVSFGLVFGGTVTGFRMYWLSVWLLAGASFVLWSRSMRWPTWVGVAGALGFMFCGFFTGHAQHTSFLVSAAFLIPALWRLEVGLTTGRVLPAVQAGALWGLSALSGYPGLTIMNGTFLAIWAFGRAWWCPEHGPGEHGVVKRSLRATAQLGVVVAIGAVVLAPTFFGFFHEGAGYTDRVGALERDRAVSSNALDPAATVTFISPYIAVLKQANRKLWPGTDPSSTSIYLTPLLLVLGLSALLSSPRNPWRWWLAASSAFFLMAALGESLPVRGWMYDYFPPSRYFRHSSMLRLFYLLPLIVLALEHLAELTRMPADRARRDGITTLITGAVLGGAASLTAYNLSALDIMTPPGLQRAMLATTMAWAGAIAVALALVVASRTLRSWLPVTVVLLVAIDGVAAVRLSHFLMVVRDRVGRQCYEEAMQDHRGTLDLGPGGLNRAERAPYGPWLTNLNWASKVPVLMSYGPLTSRFFVGWTKTPELSTMALGSDRTWFATEAAECARNVFHFHALRKAAVSRSTTPLFLHTGESHEGGDPDCGVRMKTLPDLERIAVEVEEYSANRMVIAVHPEQDGVVMVTDRFAPGWKVTVNELPARVFNANFGFRAVAVAAGHNRIDFRYRPAGYPWLLVLSWVCLAGVVAASVAGRLRRREKGAVAPPGSS